MSQHSHRHSCIGGKVRPAYTPTALGAIWGSVAQGCFDMWTAGPRDQSTNLLITDNSGAPPESQQPSIIAFALHNLIIVIGQFGCLHASTYFRAALMQRYGPYNLYQIL